MPDTTYGRATSLAWAAGPSGSPITSIQSYEFSQNKEFAEFLNGNARVRSFYKGAEDATIKISTKDIGTARLFTQGQILANVVLTWEGATQADNTAATAYKVTLSQAMVNSPISFNHGNEDSAPALMDLEFRLCRKEADAADPTVTFATA